MVLAWGSRAWRPRTATRPKPLVEGGDKADGGLVGADMADVAAIAMHADLDRWHARNARQETDFCRHIDHEHAALPIVEVIED